LEWLLWNQWLAEHQLLLNEGKLGILFEPKNPQDLAEKLNNVLSSNHKFSENELVNFANEFDYNLVCEKIENLIN
jgi:Fe-S cluster biosynthesis and repair protein YggX